jgi:Protein of unknown function (DUF3551)
MRILFIVGAMAAVLIIHARPSQAYEGPWCAQFWGGDTQIERCSMRSFAMCLNEIRGTGGNTLCSPNPRYRPSSIEPSEHARSSRRKRSF